MINFVAFGVETSACTVLFLQRTLFTVQTELLILFSVSFPFGAINLTNSEYERNKSPLVLSVDEIHND